MLSALRSYGCTYRDNTRQATAVAHQARDTYIWKEAPQQKTFGLVCFPFVLRHAHPLVPSGAHMGVLVLAEKKREDASRVRTLYDGCQKKGMAVHVLY